MKTLNFEGYEREFFKDINLKIVAEILKLPEGKDLKMKFGDGEVIIKKIKGIYNENKS